MTRRFRFRPVLERLETRCLPAPVTPTLTSTPSPTSITLSTSSVILKDTATLSGGSSPTGTLTFTLVGPNGSTVDTETATVAGNATYTTPSGYTVAAAGTSTGIYQWNVSYGGDTNNTRVADNGSTNEQVTVGPALSTTPSAPSVTLGTSSVTLTDTATLSAGANPTGTLTFALVAPGGATIDTEQVLVNGNASYTTPTGYVLPTSGTVAGTYQWNIAYSGDTNNVAVSLTNATSGQTVVSKATPNLTATPGKPVVLGTGSKLTDSVTLANAYNAGGYITFTLTTPGGVSLVTDIIVVHGNGTYSTKGYLPTAPGAYQWLASYSGDGNDATINSTATESVKTGTTPTLTVKANSAMVISSSTKLTESATLLGGDSPTGTITFYLFAPGVTPNSTNSNNIYNTTKTVSSNNSYKADGYTLTGTGTLTGTYKWVVVYSGDNKNNPVTASATQQVKLATPTLTATVPPGGFVVLGGNLSDSATLSRGFNPAGSLLFTLTGPGGGTVYSQVVSITSLSAYPIASLYASTALGTYQWSVSYSGDGNNNAVTAKLTGQTQKVAKANTPTLTSQPGPAVLVGSGARFTDSVILTGGSSPTGTMTFTLYLGNTAVDVETVPVNGDTTYTTPRGYLPTSAGTYEWVASYSGDTNNNAKSSDAFEVATQPVNLRWQRS